MAIGTIIEKRLNTLRYDPFTNDHLCDVRCRDNFQSNIHHHISTMFKYKHEQARAKMADASKSGNNSQKQTSSWASAYSPSSSSSTSSSSAASSSSSSQICHSSKVYMKPDQYENYKNSVFNVGPFSTMCAKPGVKVDTYEYDNKRYTYKNDKFSLGTSFTNSRVYKYGKEVGFQSTSFDRNSTECPKCKCFVMSEVARRTTYTYRGKTTINPPARDFTYSNHKCKL